MGGVCGWGCEDDGVGGGCEDDGVDGGFTLYSRMMGWVEVLPCTQE